MKQKECESVATWTGWLEDAIAQQHHRSKITASASEDMLHNKFWVGLLMDGLKNETRHKFDGQDLYLDLLGYARSVEQELVKTGLQKPKLARK